MLRIRKPGKFEGKVRSKVTSKKPSIWFTLDERRLGEYGIIARRHREGRKGQSMAVFAAPLEDKLVQRELGGDRLTLNEIVQIDDLRAGFLIPQISDIAGFEDLLAEPVDLDLIERLTISCAYRITQTRDGRFTFNPNSDSPIVASKDGNGNCVHRASNLAGMFRGLGISARVVGRRDLLRGSDFGHWWVEIEFNNQIIQVDPSFPQEILEVVAADREGNFSIETILSFFPNKCIIQTIEPGIVLDRVVALEIPLEKIDFIEI